MPAFRLPRRFSALPWATLLPLIISGFRAAPAQAIEPTKALTQYPREVWQQEEGLPENDVTAIVQTRDGYLWLGTEEGLVRFDGIHFTVFDSSNTPELARGYISTLTEGRDGSLWIGTIGGGVYRLKDGKISGYPTEDGLANDDVQSLYESDDGSLWIGTEGHGLGRLKDGKFSRYTSKDGLVDDFVWTLMGTNDGSLWIGTNHGLNRLKDGKFTLYTTREGLPSNVVWSLGLGRAQSLWVGTNDGLCRMAGGKLQAHAGKEASVKYSVRSIYEDQQGTLWIGTEGHGMVHVANGKASAYTTKEGLSNDTVLAITEDSEGSLWLGTSGGGLVRLKDAAFTTYGNEPGLTMTDVNAIEEGHDGSVWIGTTGGGLYRLKDGKVTRYTSKQGLPSDEVWSLLESRDGSIWAGTKDAGLARIQNGQIRTYSLGNTIPNDSEALLEDQQGNLWIGTRGGGLYRLRDGKFSVYSTRDGLPSDNITALYEDPEGMLWIASEKGLVAMGGGNTAELNGGGVRYNFRVYTTKDGLASNDLCSIYQDREGTFWIGSCSGGLSRFKQGKFTAYTRRQGLFDDTQYQILEDDQGNLWMSCNKGVYRASKKELNEFAQGTIKGIHCVSYGVSDGMGSRECNGGFQPAGWKTKDGRLWFPTLKGVAVVDPAHLRAEQHPSPRVKVEQVLIDGQPVSDLGVIRVPAGHSKLEFHYTGLSFSAPRKVQFKFQLVGFDSNWVDAGSQRIAYYTNVPVGRYRFQVTACNGEGIWSREGASVDLYLEPHFYQTLWFYTLSGLLLLAAARGGYRLRTRQIRARESALEECVKQRTGELQKEIAERKRTEEELRYREAELRDALRAAQMGVWNWTVATDAVTWDETLYRITGRDPNLPPPDSKEEAKIFTAESFARLNAAVEKTLATGTPYEVDVEIVLADGSKKWLTARGEPRRDAQGRIIWLRGTLQDITERKRSQELKALLASIVESSDDAIIGKALDGTILSWNKGAELLYGYSAGEVIGKSISILAPADRSEEIANILKKIRRGEKVSHFETVRRRQDGTQVDVSVTVSPIMSASGEAIGAATITHDISERKRNESELHKAKEAAEAASRAKSMFLANMSHEIRTPINGVLGMTELTLETDLTAEQREYLGMVKSSGEALLTVLNDVLDFSKIEAGRLDLDPICFHLRDCLDDTLKLFALRADEKGLELTCDVRREVPEVVVADPSRLRQIIINLVGNAIKFTPQGEVGLEVSLESRSSDRARLHFTVRDTGIGIAPEKQKVIFEAFSQADGSTTRVFGGTGLGLTISLRLVNMMAGRMWVESELGKGSRFHFTIEVGAAAEVAEETPERVRLAGLGVLVVDDNPTNRRILGEMLRHWEMRPELAASGVEAITQLKQADRSGAGFALLLVDAQMPDMDGFTLVERIRQQADLRGMTIMMLTSSGQRGDAARCRELGIAAYLVKPIVQAQLHEALLSVLAAKAKEARAPGEGPGSEEAPSAPLVTRHSLREARQKLHILLAEDNFVNQLLAARLLEKQGHTVVVAGNGRTALEELAKQPFDLIVMDVSMPEMDGFEAVAAIRAQEAVSGSHIPIIAVTAHAMKGDRERCLAAGMDAYISKPIQPDELHQAIKTALLAPQSAST